MKRKIILKVILLVIILLVIGIALIPQKNMAVTEISTGTIDRLSYTVCEENEQRYVKITGFNSISYGKKSVTIPETIENYPVTHIGDGAFARLYYIDEINLPDSITTIGDRAFFECSDLITIQIPQNVTKIGEFAFSDCTSLTTIKIPSGVRIIKNNVFYDCSSLNKVEIPNTVTSIETEAFSGCSSLNEIKIPSGITSIENNVFYNCSSLNKVEIPNTVRTIGNNAFSGCSSLKEIEMPDSVNSVGEWVFFDCIGLENVRLSKSLRRIGQDMFSGCTSLTTIEIPDSITTIASGAFNECTNLKTINIPGSVMGLDSGVFSNCSSLVKIKIPNSVTTIGSGCFRNCTSLKTIELPNSLGYIYSGMFQNCTSLETVKAEGMNHIGSRAFENCTNLKYINAKKVGYIDGNAFKNCINLEKIEFAEAVSTIGSNAFENCINLKEIAITSVRNISQYAFYGCANLTKVHIEETLNSIGTYAFEKCSKLSSIILPSSLQKIEGWAYYGCTSLTEIYIPQSAELGINVFYGWTENQTINIEADETPTTWIQGWNGNCNAKINYGIKRVAKLEAEQMSIGYKTPVQLDVKITPENAYNKKLKYKSGNEEILTIDENGVITPISNGSTWVTISSTDYSNINIQCFVQVIFKVTDIVLDKTEIIFNDLTTTQDINITLLPEDAYIKNYNWNILGEGVANLDGNTVIPYNNGECEIVFWPYDGPNVTATCKVKVDIKAQKVELEKESITFNSKYSQKLRANFEPRQTNNKKLTWVSSNPNIATVDENGNVTPISNGKCEISCTTQDGTNLTDKCEIIVDLRYDISEIKLNKTNIKFTDASQIEKITATYNPTNAYNPSLKWMSTDPSVAIVEGGYVRPINYGQCQIICYSQSNPNIRATCTVTVEYRGNVLLMNINKKYNSTTNTVTVEAKSNEILAQTKPTWVLSADKKTYVKTYTQNGTYTTTFTDIYGNTSKETFTINEIDDKGPKITINQKYNSETNTVTVEAISNETLGKTKPTWTLRDDKITYVKEYNTNGIYTTKFEDIYGNVISKTFTVNEVQSRYKIDKMYDVTTNTVKVTVANNYRMQATKPTWQLSENQTIYSKTYNLNGEYTTKFVDVDGNETSLSFTISEIDKIAPNLTPKIKYNEETNTVTVEITSDEILGQTKPTWVLSADKKVYSKTYNLNGTYTTAFKDIHGNSKTLTFTIDKIESKYIITKIYNETTNTITVNVTNNYGMQATKPTWSLSADKTIYTKTYNAKGTYTTKFVDIDGNEASLTFTI